MTNTTVPEIQEVEKVSRYKVSRKGMGGRKPKYNEEQLRAMLTKRDTERVSLKAQCRELGLPYVSVNAAIARMGLKTKTESI